MLLETEPKRTCFLDMVFVDMVPKRPERAARLVFGTSAWSAESKALPSDGAGPASNRSESDGSESYHARDNKVRAAAEAANNIQRKTQGNASLH